MDIQELMKQYTNEEGVTDFGKVNSAITADVELQIGAVKSKTKKKMASEMETLQIEKF